jgi:hypothetical protein
MKISDDDDDECVIMNCDEEPTKIRIMVMIFDEVE